MTSRLERLEDRQALLRIVALLFSLAAFAQRVSLKPGHAGHRVVCYLLYAEYVVLGIADRHIWSGRCLPMPAPRLNHDLVDPGAEAARLALNFRILALTLTLIASSEEEPHEPADQNAGSQRAIISGACLIAAPGAQFFRPRAPP